MGARYNALGVACALLILQVPFFMVFQLIVNRFLDSSFKTYFKVLSLPLLCCAAMTAVLFGIRSVTGAFPDPLRLVLLIISGVMVYCGTGFLINRNFLLKSIKSVFINPGQ